MMRQKCTATSNELAANFTAPYSIQGCLLGTISEILLIPSHGCHLWPNDRLNDKITLKSELQQKLPHSSHMFDLMIPQVNLTCCRDAIFDYYRPLVAYYEPHACHLHACNMCYKPFACMCNMQRQRTPLTWDLLKSRWSDGAMIQQHWTSVPCLSDLRSHFSAVHYDSIDELVVDVRLHTLG